MKKRIDYKVFMSFNGVDYGFKTTKEYNQAAVLRRFACNSEILFQFLMDCVSIDYRARAENALLDNTNRRMFYG